MKKQLLLCALTLFAGAVLIGCTSISSTMVQRSEDNTEWQRGPRTTGVPITLKVPTHIRVEIREQHYLQQLDDDEPVQPVVLDVPLRSVSTAIIKTDKIFTVDPKRPGAGTAKNKMTFQGQYLDLVDYDVADQTISTIDTVLQDLTKPGSILAPKKTSETTNLKSGEFTKDEYLLAMNSVVAAELFDLADPELEENIRCFLDKHLNGCHVCNVVAPGVQPRKSLR